MAPNQTGELAWLQVIFDRAVVGMAVLDGEGRYLHANPCWLKMTGYSLDEIIWNAKFKQAFEPDHKGEIIFDLNRIHDYEVI